MTAPSSITRDTIPPPARQDIEREPMAEAMTGTFEHARDRAGNLYRRAREAAVRKEHDFEDFVKEHPVKSVLVAAGIGAGIGLLASVFLSRR